MTEPLRTAAALLIALSVAVPVWAEPLRYAVIVGNNRGADPARELRYAEQDARRFHDTLVTAGGFAPSDMTLLLGRGAGEITAALDAMEKKAQARKRQTGRPAMFIFYYSGHASGDVLETGSSSLNFDRLRTYLDRAKFDVRIAFIDSCMSGRLIRTKGGAPGPAFDIHVTDRIRSTGYAIITSSAGDELSQESRALRGSYFTHFLVSALRGGGDASRDGQVSLQEAYRYAYARTVSTTTTTVGGAQHPMYHFRLEGQGDVVLTRPGDFSSRVSVALSAPARLVMLDEAGDNILLEATLDAGSPAELMVAPGRYRLFLLYGDGRVRDLRVAVRDGERRAVSDSDFRLAELETTVARGGLFREPELTVSHRIAVGALFRRWPLEGGSASFGVTALYRAVLNSGFQPVVRLNWTTAPDAGVSTGYFDLGAMGGAGFVWHAAGALLRFEGLAGYEHLFQDPVARSARHTSGFAWLASAGVEVPVGRAFVAVDSGAGGRMFQVIGKGWVHRLDFQALVSLGFFWGDER